MQESCLGQSKVKESLSHQGKMENLVEDQKQRINKKHREQILNTFAVVVDGESCFKIPLTNSKFTLISKEDLDLVNGFKWYSQRNYNTFYARSTIKNTKGKKINMHNLLIKGDFLIDHKNGNGLDNRRSNIRVASPSQNVMNSNKTRLPCSSIYKGVYFNKKEKKWVSAITLNCKRRRIGSFFKEVDAALSYNEEAVKIFGEFALLNNIK